MEPMSSNVVLFFADFAKTLRKRLRARPSKPRVAKREIEIWLRFANLLPFDRSLTPPDALPPIQQRSVKGASETRPSLDQQMLEELFAAFISEFLPGSGETPSRHNDAPSRLQSLANRLDSDRKVLGQKADRKLYRLFFEVRDVLGRVHKMESFPGFDPYSDVSPMNQLYLPDYDEQVAVNLPCVLYGSAGRVTLQPLDPLFFQFVTAIVSIEIKRIQNCPIESCGAFFYQSPENKTACDQHLVTMRMRRARQKKKRDSADEKVA